MDLIPLNSISVQQDIKMEDMLEGLGDDEMLAVLNYILENYTGDEDDVKELLGEFDQYLPK